MRQLRKRPIERRSAPHVFYAFRRTIDRVKQVRSVVRSALPDRIAEARPEPR